MASLSPEPLSINDSGVPTFSLAPASPPQMGPVNELEPGLIRYPHNLHPLCYLISIHEAYHQASIWHNQIHLTSRKQIEIDFPGKYDEKIKHHWKALKFAEHREWKRKGKAKLKELEQELFENEKRIEHIRCSNVSRQKFDGLLKERMEKDWRRNYDLLLNGLKGVAGNALAVLRQNRAPLIALDYLWDLLEDPTCDPPKDSLYYYPGQRLTRGNGHQKEPAPLDVTNIPVLFDLPRYGRPLPIALSVKDTWTHSLFAMKQAMNTDVYAESIGNPDAPAVPIIDIMIGPEPQPQLDGSSESRHARVSSDYGHDSFQMMRGVRTRQLQLSGPLMLSLPELGSAKDEYEEAFKEFGIEFLARMLQNPKYLFEMMKYVDQEEHGKLKTENLVRLIFKVAE